MHNVNHACRVCGFLSESPPWGEDGLTPLFDFCPCCGVEHGYQDATKTGVLKYRADWIRSGAAWETPSLKPSNWLLDDQLQQVQDDFPDPTN
jgi:hypothetical protein